MNFSFHNLLSVEEILSDVLVAVDDTSMKKFTKGWYMRQVKMGLEKLNYSAPFLQMFYDMCMPDNLTLNIPSGAWNINDMFAYNPLNEKCEQCTVGNSARIYHKANFITTGKKQGYTARNKPFQKDSFSFSSTQDYNVLFYNVQNGIIMLSDSCGSYSHLRIIANGTPKDVDKVKFIPPFAREALIGWGIERAFFSLKTQDIKYRTSWVDAKQDLFGKLSPTEYSKWDECKSLFKRMDKKEMNDLSQYLSSIYC